MGQKQKQHERRRADHVRSCGGNRASHNKVLGMRSPCPGRRHSVLLHFMAYKDTRYAGGGNKVFAMSTSANPPPFPGLGAPAVPSSKGRLSAPASRRATELPALPVVLRCPAWLSACE